MLSEKTLLEILKALMASVWVFLAGTWRAELRQSEADLRAIERANKAAAGVELLGAADVVRDLKQRRLYRVSGK